MRFIHVADIHLDSPLRGLRTRAGERAQHLVGATRRALEGLVDFAVEERVDLVVIAGDVFDGDWPDHSTGLFFVSMLGRLDRAGIPVALIRGNHDAESVITKKLRWPGNVHEFGTRSAGKWHVPGLDVVVHGQSFANRAVPENLAAGYPAPVPGHFNIGLLHTSCTGRPGHDTYAPCEVAELVGKGYDYWALGHIHGREVLHEHPHVVFPGNLQGRHVNEPGAKGFTLVTVEGGRVARLEAIPADVARWARLEVDISSAETIADIGPLVSRALEGALAAADGRTLALRLVLTGASPAHRVLAGDPERLDAECASAALLSGGDVWIERVEVQTTVPARQDPPGGEGFADILRLLREVSADPAEREALLGDFEAGLSRIPRGARAEAGLDALDEAQAARVLADAEALLLHHLIGGEARA